MDGPGCYSEGSGSGPTPSRKGCTLIKNSVYDYLMDELTDVREFFSEEHEVVIESLCLVAASGEHISEVMLKLYLAPLQLDSSLLSRGIEYMSGMGIITVECDCVHLELEYEVDNGISTRLIDFNEVNPCIVPSSSSVWFLKGFDQVRHQTEEWKNLTTKVSKIKEDLINF